MTAPQPERRIAPGRKNRKYTVQEFWDGYAWPEDGDEWKGQAIRCSKPYHEWKMSLLETFISETSVVLEIASGRGRWAKEIIQHCKELILVDTSLLCMEFCRNAFSSFDHIKYIVNDGKSLPSVDENVVDLVYSFDSFVHFDKSTIVSYLNEIHRVLKPNMKAIIHHAGRKHAFLWLSFLRTKKWNNTSCELWRYLTMSGSWGSDNDGGRSAMSVRLFKKLAIESGLEVLNQVQYWGNNNEFGVPRFDDCITVLRKKSASPSAPKASPGT